MIQSWANLLLMFETTMLSNGGLRPVATVIIWRNSFQLTLGSEYSMTTSSARFLQYSRQRSKSSWSFCSGSWSARRFLT